MNEEMKALIALCDYLGLSLQRQLEDGTWHDICEDCFKADNPEYDYIVVIKP